MSEDLDTACAANSKKHSVRSAMSIVFKGFGDLHSVRSAMFIASMDLKTVLL